MNWRDAFLTQAWSDFLIFREMNNDRYPTCHALHYLQMATEKLAKGFMSKRSVEPSVSLTHYSLVNFLQVSKGRRDWREKMGFGHNARGYAAYIDRLLPIAGQIEKLVPGGNHRMNAEYPWINEEGYVDCPCKYDFADIDQSNLTNFRTLIHSLFRIEGFQD